MLHAERMTVADAVRLARSQKGMTQEQLAKAVGVDRVTVARLESGATKATVETLSKLCGVLGLSMDALLKITKPRKSA